jgi:acyl-CoA synthetase (AMP-forming)/AMP-acid ligase II
VATDYLTEQAAARPDDTAVIVDGSGGALPLRATYAELNDVTNRLSNALLETMAPRERLVWCGPNSLQVIVVLGAARKVRLVAVPLSYRFTAEEMAYVVDNSDATCVIADAEYAPVLASVADRCPKVRTWLAYTATEAPPPVPAPFRHWDEVLTAQPTTEPVLPEDPGFGGQMIYTSGTTGKPKGALRTSSDPELLAALLQQLDYFHPNGVHLTTGPLYHSGPLAFAGLAGQIGHLVVLLRKFDARRWLELVTEHKVTNTFSAPTQLKRIVSQPDDVLAQADLSHMVTLIANAAPVPYALKEEIFAKLGTTFLYEVYGSTELGVDTVMQPADQLRKPGSCGKPYGSIEVRIVADDGSTAPVGEPGELFVRTGLAMDGYYRTDEALAEADGEGGGWKSVGDVAYVDDEGFVYICDRKKDMIISGGMNIYPAEVEAPLYEHPQILDAAVFGIPDDEWGESVHAVVQPKPGEVLDLDEVRAFVEPRLAGYKRPRSYEVRDELPRTDSGKLLKRLLRDEFWKDRKDKV